MLVVVVGGACAGDSEGLDAMSIQKLSASGRVEIHRGNETILVEDGEESLEPQDVIQTDGDATARLRLEGNRTVTLARDTRVLVRSTTGVEGQSGSLLAIAKGESTQVFFDDVTARFSSAKFRLDSGVGSARAASYSGNVQLVSPGEARVTLARLRQVDVAAGDLPEKVNPYRVDPSDPWDQEQLEDVVALTQELELLARGFSRQIGSSRPGAEYFSSLTSRNVGFVKDYLNRRVTDLLVAFSIAMNDPGRSLESSFEKVFGYLDDGAQYGVAATIMGVSGRPVVAQLEGLIVDTGAVASNGGGGTASFALGSAAGGSATGSDGNDDTSTSASGSGDTVSGGVGGETQDEVNDCANTVDCTLDDVQDIPPGPSDPQGGSGGGGGGGSGGGQSGEGELTDILPDPPLGN